MCATLCVGKINDPDDLCEWKIFSEMRSFSIDQFQYMVKQWGENIKANSLPSRSFILQDFID